MRMCVVFAACIFVLSACHHYTNDYINAKNEPELKTPAGVTQPTFTEHNPVPMKTSAATVAAPDLIPPGLTEDQVRAVTFLSTKKDT